MPSPKHEISRLTRVRYPAVGDQLGEQYPEGPNVRLDAELAIVGRLGRGPLDREPGAHARLVLVLLDENESVRNKNTFVNITVAFTLENVYVQFNIH